MMSDDNGINYDAVTKKKALIIIVLVSPLYLVYAYLGDWGRARAAGIAGFILAILLFQTWNLKKHVWYFPVVLVLLVAHTLLVVYIPWTDASFPGRTLLPIGLLDLAICYGIIKLAEGIARWFSKSD